MQGAKPLAGGAGGTLPLTRVGFLGSRWELPRVGAGVAWMRGVGPCGRPLLRDVFIWEKNLPVRAAGVWGTLSGGQCEGAPANSSLPCVRLRRTLLANEIKSAMQCHLSTKG